MKTLCRLGKHRREWHWVGQGVRGPFFRWSCRREGCHAGEYVPPGEEPLLVQAMTARYAVGMWSKMEHGPDVYQPTLTTFGRVIQPRSVTR